MKTINNKNNFIFILTESDISKNPNTKTQQSNPPKPPYFLLLKPNQTPIQNTAQQYYQTHNKTIMDIIIIKNKKGRKSKYNNQQNTMQFTQFSQLQTLRQDFNQQQHLSYMDAPFSNFNVHLHLHVKDIPIAAQFHHVLSDIHDINYARSIVQVGIDDGGVGGWGVDVGEDGREEQQIEKEEEIVFTPTKISFNQSRRSTIFTATRSLDQHPSPKPSTLRIYYFGQPTTKQITIEPTTTIDTLISRSLSAYSQDYSLDQTFITSKDPKNYQMRFIKDQGTCLPDYSVQAVKRDRVIGDSLFQVLVMVRTNKEMWRGDSKESDKADADNVKLNIFNQANLHVSSIIVPKNQTIKKAIDYLQTEIRQKIVLYEDFDNDTPLPEDMDIKNLCTYKLFVKKRRFLDEPQPEHIAPLKITTSLPKDLSQSPVLPPIGITEASRYEQFQVVKINVRGVEQARIIGFDQTKYYNYDVSVRKKHKQASFFSVFIGNNILTGTKKPEKPITQILAINELSGVNFELVFAEKKIQFKAMTVLDKLKIVRKVRFLIQYNKQRMKIK